MSIEVLNESGVDLDPVAFLTLARFTLTRMRVHPEAELCLRFVDADTIAQYNQQWMDKPGPTDVLSFPMDELRPAVDDEPEAEGVLGDMLLCPQHAAAQAPSFHRSLDEELALLTIHGILHLLGYDHADPSEEQEMFGLQARLLAEWLGAKSGEPVE